MCMFPSTELPTTFTSLTCPSVFTYSLMDFSKNTSLETLTVDFAWAPSLWYTGQTRHVNDARLAMSFLSQFCHTPLRVISLRIIISADRDTLLRQLRHLRFDWLGIFVKHTLDELVDTGEQEGVRVLVENLQNLNVELRFSCDLRPHEARRVRRHVDSQLDSFTADGFLDLVVV
ncbi:hypothetical protein BC835DRAFT_1368667 [Cytidiella melzeri]|nr:hypothetical protein BC835DRAFT_1368667 [Cytidiella melzeri]